MIYTMEKVSVGCFLTDYNISDDQAYRVAWMLLAAKPMHKSQKKLSGQAWLDEYARIVHQTSGRFKDDSIIVVPILGEFLAHVAEMKGETDND